MKEFDVDYEQLYHCNYFDVYILNLNRVQFWIQVQDYLKDIENVNGD